MPEGTELSPISSDVAVLEVDESKAEKAEQALNEILQLLQTIKA